jgi:spectinomycin phosphotransferase
MKEKPDLQDKFIFGQLREIYGVEAVQLDFLPIGDISSAKYRVITDELSVYFLKLRKEGFKEISVSVPDYLHEQGIYQVISPIKTKDGRLWSHLYAYTCILYPFITGKNGFQEPLSDDQWIELGNVLNAVHSVHLSPAMQTKVPRQSFSPDWRDKLKEFLAQIEKNSWTDPVAAKLAESLQEHQDEICRMIERAEELGNFLQTQPIEQVLCHADIHAGNILLESNGTFHIIDWDDPIIAPKERDLMFIGGGIGGIWGTPREEELFYQGYGRKDINLTALTYYRYERIVSDMVDFCQQILGTTSGGADRERILQKFYSAFLPHQTLEIAYQTDQRLKSILNS